MTLMTIKIVMKGLGLCYHKDGQWKSILPFDEFHRVYFSCEKDGVITHHPTPLANKRSISLTTATARPAEMPSQANFEDFLDLTASYAHDQGIRIKTDWNDRSVLLTIPDAVFSTKEQTEMEYLVFKPGTNYAVDMGKVGLVSEAEINLEDGGSVTVEADGEQLATINYQAGANYTITFDNDCPENLKHPENDFVIYYDIIEDVLDPNLRLEVLAKVAETAVKNTPQVLKDLSPSFGHGCRPCICANVTVSQTDNLP